MAAGSSGTFTAIYTVNAGTASGTVITDTATVNAANQAFGPNSATATDVVATGIQADLALTTVGTPATVIPGNNITYTHTVTNNGPASASAVNFTEAIPANTTFASVSAPVGWTCTVHNLCHVYRSDPRRGCVGRHHRCSECRLNRSRRDDHRELLHLRNYGRSQLGQ